MSNLKELTWEYHQKAERTEHARKLLKGMTPYDYHKYLLNQYWIYMYLEEHARNIKLFNDDLADRLFRSDKIRQDLEELEKLNNLQRSKNKLCPVVLEYSDHVSNLNKDETLAHIYVRHFGDMYGGQMIRKRNPGSGRMYDFDEVEELKTTIRDMLHDGMAKEAIKCFEFAMKLFEQLDGHALNT